MRMHLSPVVLNKRPLAVLARPTESGTFSHMRSSFSASVQAHFFHTVVLLMPSGPIRFFSNTGAAKLLRSDGGAAGTSICLTSHHRAQHLVEKFSITSNGFAESHRPMQPDHGRCRRQN